MSEDNVGSLLRLFKSKHFTVWMAVSYLYKHATNKSVQQYLSNELYDMKQDDLDYYLPQLCNLVIWQHQNDPCPPLLVFLLDMCSKCIHFSLKITWLFSALSDMSNPQQMRRCQLLRGEAEVASYNGRRPGALPSSVSSALSPPTSPRDPPASPPTEVAATTSTVTNNILSLCAAVLGTTKSPSPQLTSSDGIFSRAESQLKRCEFFRAVQSFSEMLGKLSASLIPVPRESRNEYLVTELTLLNEKLREYPGIYLPLASASELHMCVVRIPPREAIALSSRDRAPFLILVECLTTEGVFNADPTLYMETNHYAKLFEEIPNDLHLETKEAEGESKGSACSSTESVENDGQEKPDNKDIGKTGDESAVVEGDSVWDMTGCEDMEILPTTPRDGEECGASKDSSRDSSNTNEEHDTEDSCSTGEESSDSPSDEARVPETGGEEKEVNTDKPSVSEFNLNEPKTPVTIPPIFKDPPKVTATTTTTTTEATSSTGVTVPPAPSTTSPTDSSSGDNWVIPPIPVLPTSCDFPCTENGNKEGEAAKLEAGPVLRRSSILFVRENWSTKTERLRAASPFGKHPNWCLRSLIVKYGDDCRQERMALQLINQFHKIFQEAKLPLFVKPYDILVISPITCLIETVTNSMSIHQMKKDFKGTSLSDYFAKQAGGTTTRKYERFRCNFIDSLAAYSLIMYILQVKDRHNGNILVLNTGHIVHIDFGFLLTNCPGGINFETSPFKLTQEYIEFIGGLDSPMWEYFRALIKLGFFELRKHSEKLIGLVEMALQTGSNLPCFSSLPAEQVIDALRGRFFLGKPDLECEAYMDGLIKESMGNWRTIQYEKFQYNTNGILY